MFYENKLENAIELSKSQLKEGWNVDEIASYWHYLGYDEYFINQIKHSLVN
jgi:hypothetical protein